MSRMIALGKTQLRNMAIATAMYYLIYFVCAFAVQFMLLKLEVIERIDFSTGVQVNSVIFLFIMGIIFIRSTFNFGTSNSVSRRTMFLTLLCMFVALTAVTSIFDMVFNGGNNLLGGIINIRGSVVETFVLSFCYYMLVIMSGVFVSLLYYRLSKLWKWVISAAGIAAVMFAPLGIALLAMNDSPILDILIKVINFASETYLNAILVQVILFALVTVLSFLIFRRMPVKETSLA